jgi:hypothetical protein
MPGAVNIKTGNFLHIKYNLYKLLYLVYLEMRSNRLFFPRVTVIPSYSDAEVRTVFKFGDIGQLKTTSWKFLLAITFMTLKRPNISGNNFALGMIFALSLSLSLSVSLSLSLSLSDL